MHLLLGESHHGLEVVAVGVGVRHPVANDGLGDLLGHVDECLEVLAGEAVVVGDLRHVAAGLADGSEDGAPLGRLLGRHPYFEPPVGREVVVRDGLHFEDRVQQVERESDVPRLGNPLHACQTPQKQARRCCPLPHLP